MIIKLLYNFLASGFQVLNSKDNDESGELDIEDDDTGMYGKTQ